VNRAPRTGPRLVAERKRKRKRERERERRGRRPPTPPTPPTPPPAPVRRVGGGGDIIGQQRPLKTPRTPRTLPLSSLWQNRLPLVAPPPPTPTPLATEMTTPVILYSSTTLFALISPPLMSYGDTRRPTSSIPSPRPYRVAIKVGHLFFPLHVRGFIYTLIYYYRR
jgi:hypothetical protein